jgi:hypothetical protein
MEEDQQLIDTFDVINDPVRFKIFSEIFFKNRITANELLEVIPINRSTLSFHLTKMVKACILTVEMNPTGRATKFYSLAKTKFKIELGKGSFTDSMSIDEKKRILVLKLRQMAMEFRVGGQIMTQYADKVFDNHQITDIHASHSKLTIVSDHSEDSLINGGIYYVTKEQSERFMQKISQVLADIKQELVETAQKPTEMTDVIILGSLPLDQPIKVLIKRK